MSQASSLWVFLSCVARYVHNSFPSKYTRRPIRISSVSFALIYNRCVGTHKHRIHKIQCGIKLINLISIERDIYQLSHQQFVISHPEVCSLKCIFVVSSFASSRSARRQQTCTQKRTRKKN